MTNPNGSEPSGDDHRPEPVLKASLVTMSTAILGLLVAFGVDLNDDQRTALLALITALVPVVAMIANWIARSKVTPVTSPRDQYGRALVPLAGTGPRPRPGPEPGSAPGVPPTPA